MTEASHPFAGNWWPPGHLLGYEHTFVHTFADFVTAIVAGRGEQPSFRDGLENERVLSAVQDSARERRWVSL